RRTVSSAAGPAGEALRQEKPKCRAGLPPRAVRRLSESVSSPTCFFHLAPSQRSRTLMLPRLPDATVMTLPLSVVNLISEDRKWPWYVNRSAYCGSSIRSRGLITPLALSSLPLSRIACRSSASEGFVAAAKPATDMPRRRSRRSLPHTGRPLLPPVLP